MRAERPRVWNDVLTVELAAQFALQIAQSGWTFARRNHDDFGSLPVLVDIEANGESRNL
jgi:hypothetical protein